MNGDVVLDTVNNPHEHRVAFPSEQSGSRELTIDGDNRLSRTQSCGRLHRHLHRWINVGILTHIL